MPKKATRKAKKTVEPDAAGITAGEGSAPNSEATEPTLDAVANAGLDTGAERRSEHPTAASGEGEALAQASDTFEQAVEDTPEFGKAEAEPESDEAEAPEPAPIGGTDIGEIEEELTPAERPPARLERLQKILSQAGIASRRHAEEMIAEGRVQVNGKTVTELGTKADPERDHIRVDGKLIRGAERLRYFVLNKPRGYVTTVSDPEGRPTVMEFFRKMGERLYPVGRLDYLSEGLLLVTNDGDLANKLTKAATGVEKTYLVKVSGQPTGEELDRLREGVAIDRTRPGEGRVNTAPATIREVRSGDNPWYEVVLTEGRNRELRKMFEEIGHHVEKIRRVGYGPLVLDVEPGRFRELEPGELAKLRLAAEGKWRKPKAPESRAAGRRGWGDKPKEIRHEAGRGPSMREARPGQQRRREDRGGFAERPERRRPPQRTGEWRRPAAQGEGFQRSSPGPSEREQGFERRRTTARPPQGSRPDRRHQEGEREGAGRQERTGSGSRYRESRPRFADRERAGDRPRGNRARNDRGMPDRARFEDSEGWRRPSQRTGSRPPRREGGPPEQRIAPSRPRPASSKFGAREDRPAREFRGGQTGPPRSGGRNAGRPNRPSGPGTGRPPFKKASGRSSSSPQKPNPRGGPRRRRD